MAAAPFVVGRPDQSAPFSSPFSSPGVGLRHRDYGLRRARTTLSTEITPAHTAVTNAREAATSSIGAWPRVVVRDVTGRTLDTFTTLQDAIYRASWTVKTRHEWPVTPLEWRLPKAPVPSKPDFSRAGTLPRAVTSYSLHLGRSYRVEVQSAPVRPVLEIDVDDVSFVAESLKLLPQLPSFAFLRHSLLAGERTYLRIVGSILLHQRQLAASDKREADYSFPGFCTGCKRAGFCYGCDKNPRPHVHEDVPMRTGGGFVYYRKDRPLNEHPHRHPLNWPIADPDHQLRDIIAKCGGLAEYERAALAAHHVMLRSDDVTSEILPFKRLQRIKLLSGPWPGQTNVFSTTEADSRQGEAGEEEEEGEAGEEEADVSDEEGEDEASVATATERRSRKTSRLASGVTDGSLSGKKKVSIATLRHSVTIDTGGTRIYTDDTTNDEDDEAEEDEEREGQEGEEGRAERLKRVLGDLETGTETEYDSGFEGGSDLTRSRRVGVVQSPTRAKRPSTLSPTRSVTFTRSGSRSRSTSRSRSPAVAFGGSVRSRENTGKSRSTESAETSESRKSRLENIPFAGKRRDVLYKPPAAFKPVKKNRRITVAKDPFSTDRQYDLPKGGSFTIKKGERKATQFVNVKRGDDGWKAPKKFELKEGDRKTTQFWTPKLKSGDKGKGRRGHGDDDDGQGRGRRRKLPESEDSGLDSDLRSASTRGKGDGGADQDQTENDGGEKGTGDDAPDSGADAQAELKKRREIVKKSRRPLSPPGVKVRPRSPTPPPPPREPTPEPPPPTPPPESPQFVFEEPALPDITLPDIPDLPEWQEPTKAERQKKLKFMVAPPAPPVAKESPKKRRPPPKVRRPLKVPLNRPKTRPAEAPVSADQVQDMQDPLDWLAKYCIINPDRLPLYEMIFESVVEDQKPRYTKPSPKKEGEGAEGKGEEEEAEEGVRGKKRKGKKKKSAKTTGDKPADKPDQLSLLHRGLYNPKVGLSLPEQQLEKLCYTLDTLHHKLEELSTELQALEDKRTKQLAEKGRELFPQITQPDYKPKTKKKGKKKAKDTSPPRRLTEADMTDDVIVSRLDDKMLTALRHEPEVRQTELEMQRAREKTNDLQERLQQLASEKLLTDAFCVNHFFMRQGVNHRPQDFRRQQSELYNRLRPDPDFEMNMEEVADALQAVNNNLLTEKEVFFLYNVLNLPARSTLNFRLFTIVAALSEKVTQLDPVVRKLINNCDYNALDIKMEKCRELFQFLEDDDHMPKGGASADRLAVELTAGGLTPEHTKFVLKKFNREGRGVVDFLDFVTYVPLFVLIHKRIISDPLREELDL